MILDKLFKLLLSKRATTKNYLDFFRYASPFIKEIEIAEWLGNKTDDGQEVARKALAVLLDVVAVHIQPAQLSRRLGQHRR